jgi:hypothetical protein
MNGAAAWLIAGVFRQAARRERVPGVNLMLNRIWVKLGE